MCLLLKYVIYNGNDKTRTPGPWTTFVDLVHGLHSWTTDHSHGPLSWTTCKISPTDLSLGSRDWRELFHYSFHYLFHNQFSFC